jgi:hypothetical protein
VAVPTVPQSPAMIPALTPVRIEITQSLSSKKNKPGEMFTLRLADPILLPNGKVVAAGATGMGEVIEAKGGGMSGSAGVLLLAARYLNVDGRQLRLRSMHVGGAGTDRTTLADAVGIAVGFPALFISGGARIVPAGTIADAKTAESFALEAAPSPAAATLGH